ncbi:hypothetical protein F2Q69_00057862 [Brassica cretica]|uniref:NADP-dependent oxidoreductase domain-containing protein n=1 Tax=Brassica cretica TaxID=69181 RepID=A0A8S9N257_BRACR|nr:hypothetical protein F2Q69_00057862 [Brassica cretica]
MNTRPCRMVTSRYPAEGSVVMAKIDAIHSNNITISMLEYKNLKGRLLLSHDTTCVDISRLGRVEPLKAISIPQAKMELRPLGNTGLKVSSVGFGASPLGSVFGPVAEVDAVATVREAFRQGINFFDTSPYYGGTLSEKMLGKGLKALQVPRSDYIVATKCGRYEEGFDFSAERVTKSIDESLERLQLDYVDILQCHDIEFGSLDQIVSETIPALQKLKREGKTRFIGITGLPLSIFTYVLDRVPPGTVDVILSYCHYGVNDSALVDLIPYLKGKGVGVISASPLAMGLLTEQGGIEYLKALF